MSLMPPTIVRELELERHGYKIHPMGLYYQAFPDAWPKWNAWLAGLAEVLGPLLTRVPPNIGSRRPSDLFDTARLAWSERGLSVRSTADVTRLLTMSIADLLDDWFESPQLKGALAVNGVIGTWRGHASPELHT